MTLLGAIQLVTFLATALGTVYYLDPVGDRNATAALFGIGALFLVPAVIVGFLTLPPHSLEKIFLHGEAGPTFAVPCGIGVGFLLSGVMSLFGNKCS